MHKTAKSGDFAEQDFCWIVLLQLKGVTQRSSIHILQIN